MFFYSVSLSCFISSLKQIGFLTLILFIRYRLRNVIVLLENYNITYRVYIKYWIFNILLYVIFSMLIPLFTLNVCFVASASEPKTSYVTLMFFVTVAIWRENRPDCLFPLQIATTKEKLPITFWDSWLVFSWTLRHML